MPDFIKDGKGKGYLAGVTSENELIIHGSVEQLPLHTAIEYENYYTASFSDQAAGIGDTIGYIKNTSSTDKMVIDFFSIYSAASSQVHVSLGVTGTPVGGTDVVPANTTAGSGSQADGTFQDGVDITGLASGSNVYVSVTPANDNRIYNDIPIVIPPNQTIAFLAYQNTETIFIGVGFYYYQGD